MVSLACGDSYAPSELRWPSDVVFALSRKMALRRHFSVRFFGRFAIGYIEDRVRASSLSPSDGLLALTTDQRQRSSIADDGKRRTAPAPREENRERISPHY